MQAWLVVAACMARVWARPKVVVTRGCRMPTVLAHPQKSECQTCGKELARCAGHFGYVKLALPVFHIGYMKATLDILHNICKTCSRVLLNESEIMRYACLLGAWCGIGDAGCCAARGGAPGSSVAAVVTWCCRVSVVLQVHEADA